MRVSSHLAKSGSFARFNGVDPERRALTQTAEDALNGVGAVAVAAQMGEKDLAPARTVNGLEKIAGGPIGKVAVTAAYALLDGPGTFLVSF